MFGIQVLSKFAIKVRQNCPPLLAAVLTLPCETKSICS